MQQSLPSLESEDEVSHRSMYIEIIMKFPGGGDTRATIELQPEQFPDGLAHVVATTPEETRQDDIPFAEACKAVSMLIVMLGIGGIRNPDAKGTSTEGDGVTDEPKKHGTLGEFFGTDPSTN